MIKDLLAPHDATRPAIGAPGRPWLNFGELRRISDEIGTQLRNAGMTRQDRVALVLPNGPEMACAFVTIAQHATTAPLNPNYTQDEFRYYLDDLGAKALVVMADHEGPALEAATSLGIDVLHLTPDLEGPAGHISLMVETEPHQADTAASDQDVALILHTSGTTSRPKIVPLTQANLTASARNIAQSLALTTQDRSLNVMPLFHIHGLVASVLASLGAGASVWCSPGFDALKVFGWMREAQPSWITAVPTMHQAILARSGRNRDTIDAVPLRFLRSSSASLPGPVMQELARTFGAPVIEAYGMTEAAHQMTCNPLATGKQRPGSVGVAAGPEVRIADEQSARLVDGIGEVVISGPNVTPGYDGNPSANAQAFFEAEGKRWFRTGDQGGIDSDGYLTLTGRLKEIINRGGEKISPLEVDGILSGHRAVAQCVTFAVPHEKLGEDVAVAVVLKDGEGASETDIRAYLAERLASFKVPRQVLILDDIPKGNTGKLQRIGLAEKLGLT